MCGNQLGFSDYELTKAKKQSNRVKIISEMKETVHWQTLIELNEPY